MEYSVSILCVWAILMSVSVGDCSLDSTASGQYHIQTDEGPERYFRFQTHNGQFRKERRLQDGTVIGTEAWIDAAGYLRQKDYIADKKGYRILKSKTVFVGQHEPIQDALQSTKSVPAQSGVLVGRGGSSHDGGESPSRGYKHEGYVYSTTAAPIVHETPATASPSKPPHGTYLSPEEAAKLEPSPYLGFDHYPDELPRPAHGGQSQVHGHAHSHSHTQQQQQIPKLAVHIRPYSEPLDESRDTGGNSIADGQDEPAWRQFAHSPSSSTTTARPPSLEMEPPFQRAGGRYHQERHRPIAIVSTTPAPIAVYGDGGATPTASYPFAFSSPAPFTAAPSTVRSRYPEGFADGYPHYAPTAAPTPAPTPAPIAAYDSDYYAATTARPAASLAYESNSLESGLLPPLEPWTARRLRPLASVRIANAGYDGVATTRNGFGYYLPQHYHEEEQIDDEKRAGSFGYVDPFGIRRVVYYNASPNKGFVHRNSNRYVGVGARPYEPAP